MAKSEQKKSGKNNDILVEHTERPRTFEIILFGGGMLLLLYLVYAVQTIFSPFVLLGAIIFLLYPIRRQKFVRTLMRLAIILFALWFLDTVKGILSPFLIALLIAYLFHPLVTKAEGWKIKRWVSSLVLILFFIGLLIVILFLVLPLAFQQFEGMLVAVNSIVTQLTDWILSGNFVAALNKYGISTDQLKQTLSLSFMPRLENIMKGLLEGTLGLVSGLSTVVSRIVNMVIIPFLTFYVLKDFPLIKHRAKMFLPRSKREEARRYYGLIDDLLGQYLRGAITVAIINGIAVSLFFWMFGIRYPLVLGIVAGVLDLIPYFGLIIMLVLSVIVAFFSGDPVTAHVILAAATIAFLHILEAAVLSPKIIGGKVGMHPALLILSLLVFSFFLGFIGLLIAVPTTAIVILMVKEWEQKRKAGSPFSPILENLVESQIEGTAEQDPAAEKAGSGE
ncbi:MAG: AI-2E family transporter [Bacteroidota bacterium]|nr:AI-2E family transporter [Bacteroidota bacterium]